MLWMGGSEYFLHNEVADHSNSTCTNLNELAPNPCYIILLSNSNHVAKKEKKKCKRLLDEFVLMWTLRWTFWLSLYLLDKDMQTCISTVPRRYSRGYCKASVCLFPCFQHGWFSITVVQHGKGGAKLRKYLQIFGKTENSFSPPLWSSLCMSLSLSLSLTDTRSLSHTTTKAFVQSSFPQNICTRVSQISAKIFHLGTNAHCNPCGWLE